MSGGLGTSRGDFIESVREALGRRGGEPEEAFFLARIKLTATDRGGLLRDVAAVVAEEGYSIVSATVDTTEDGVAEMTVSLNLSNISELSRLLHRLQSIRQVLTASREAPTSRPR